MAEGWKQSAVQGSTDLFYPPRGTPLADIKAICAVCPEMMECREAGMQERFGL